MSGGIFAVEDHLAVWAALPEQGKPSPGTYEQVMDLRVAGFRRSYLVHVPHGYDGETRLPLLVAIHGAFSGGKKFEKQTGFSRLADREGVIVVYPNGIGLFGLFRHWNSGHCCGKARKDGIDDVGFVMSVISEVSEALRVDQERIYLVGHSNGGMLAYRIAAERPLAVAAFGVVAATIGGKPSTDEPEWTPAPPEAPVPAVVVHGRDDPKKPYDGDRARDRHGESRSISVRRSVDFWVQANGCRPNPKLERELNSRIVRERWQACRSGSEVELYTLEGWGHDWPGPFFTRKLHDEDPLRRFDAAETIWVFLSNHRRRRESEP